MKKYRYIMSEVWGAHALFKTRISVSERRELHMFWYIQIQKGFFVQRFLSGEKYPRKICYWLANEIRRK